MDLGNLEKMIMERATKSLQNLAQEYQCSKCHDSGWLDFYDEDGNRFAQKCSCRLAREAEERLKASGLADAVREQTFDAFKTDTAMQEHMKRIAQEYLTSLFERWDEPRRPWLYVGGNPGAGKTHICTAVCGEILRHNISVRYMQWLDDSKKLKYAVNEENFSDAVEDFVNPSVLYIDDLLKQKYADNPVFTEADVKIAFTILNARYLMNKPTIISSEWDLIDQLLPADEGVFSRVYERSKEFTIRISRDRRNNYRIMGGNA
jgi:DNA replication protein DnaC